MLFNSYIFIFAFLPITFFIYFYLNHKKLITVSKIFLVFSSLFFYSYWNPIYLPLILISMLFNYKIGSLLSIGKKHKLVSKKQLLTLGIIGNIGLLGYFKYSDFFISNINSLFNSNIGLLHLALPLAISFFTFQQLAYLIDSYRGETKEYDFLNYTIFVTFFPQLIAGPIVHHKEMMPQFSRVRNKIKNYKNIAMGFFIFSIGLFKKVVIADTFAIWAGNGFDTNTILSLFEAWITSLSYTFQLYFDFSGYTDMAIGIALLFNIKLPINFNSPYKATDIQDFWRRWHITLSRFLKDYIYIPLGGNRKGEFRTYANLLSTFIIGGIWHGAGWTFVFWGFLHGLALVIHRAWSKLGIKLWTWLAWLITFNFVNISWVFFRAKEWDDAIRILKSMFGVNHIYIENIQFINLIKLDPNTIILIPVFKGIGQLDLAIYILIAILSIISLSLKNSVERLNNFKSNKTNLYFGLIAFFIAMLFINSIQETEFLYYDF